MAPDEVMPHMSWATDDGNHVMVSNLNEMISTTTLMTRADAWVPEP
jgi:hypothetical protein